MSCRWLTKPLPTNTCIQKSSLCKLSWAVQCSKIDDKSVLTNNDNAFCSQIDILRLMTKTYWLIIIIINAFYARFSKIGDKIILINNDKAFSSQIDIARVLTKRHWLIMMIIALCAQIDIVRLMTKIHWLIMIMLSVPRLTQVIGRTCEAHGPGRKGTSCTRRLRNVPGDWEQPNEGW